MTIEVVGSAEQTHIDNVFYDAHCLTCADISKESGDEIDRPLELVGFEEEATLEKAQSVAQGHDRRHPDHKIVLRKFDTELIGEALGQ